MLLGFGGSQQFDYVLICHIPIVICLIFLLGFIFKYWHEPEVRSRNHDFTLHFLGMGLLQEVVLILTAALTLQIMPLKAVDMSTGAMNPDWSTAAFWAYLWLTFCLNQLLVPNLARMRYIKALFCEQNEAVSYWILPLGYLLLWFCTTFVSLVYCQFNGSHTCNLWETYSGLIVFLALHNIHYYYCAWKSRHARHLFIDYISNIRLYTIFVLFFWVLIVITLSGENQVSLWYLYFYQPWFMLVIFSLENFAFLVARVLGRKWGGENALGGIDMVGEHYRESESRNKGVEELLGVEHTRKIIQQVARQQLCEENVDFLIAVYACNQTKPASISMVHSIASQFLESSSPKEINITGSCRDRTLKAIQSEDPMHYKDTEPLFRAAVAQVMKNVSTNCLPDVYKSKEYKKWALLEKKNMLECY
ncbi:hypothetical protein SARC_13965 [Sphaeroforma arctica JP610]|uniref:RGS domain-containing protein n=1 Tax=Sphaeroforma arctica JP610 TaxID=667725 RepID=A0A0L0F9S0_9EUKA|nr:hypothetical protein SARC_13965 [Sphaeroforma arctica JP610]KNC73477.1 hypothetical protein SARC_13965 [Sphaeroforma arctica JP610]|eukprot:XP_014147379.1 hypothetical protein SARC_13965 [Sphaeroforma arctica JP610]